MWSRNLGFPIEPIEPTQRELVLGMQKAVAASRPYGIGVSDVNRGLDRGSGGRQTGSRPGSRAISAALRGSDSLAAGGSSVGSDPSASSPGSGRFAVDSLSRAVARWIAVVGGLGYVPAAPGTAGSAAGALLFLLVFGIGNGAPWFGAAGFEPLTPIAFQVLFGAFVGSLLLVGVWAAGRAERDFGRQDDARIVIDELVGQLIALAPLLVLLRADASFFSVLVGVVTGFVLFRLFDIWKPGAVRWAERRFDGGSGVMADDLVAGVYAALALIVLELAVAVLSPASGGLLTGGGS